MTLLDQILRFARGKRGGTWRASLLLLRGIIHRGWRFECPCCGWRLQRFLAGGALFRARPEGYCPRCNAKARHRRDWLALRRLGLPRPGERLLHVAGAWCFARRFRVCPGVRYICGDLEGGVVPSLGMDVARIPLRAGSIDGVVCIHVLEHVPDDKAAIQEIFRVLRTGGWAFITVPLSTAAETYEDDKITTPDERRRSFGEAEHVRLYGKDLTVRLRKAGFEVTFFPGAEVSTPDRLRYGLKLDENIFFCKKPTADGLR